MSCASYVHEGRRMVREVSLVARPQTVTALVGPPGGGKTTIARLVARRCLAHEGAVLVGGLDMRDLTPEQVARSVSVLEEDAAALEPDRDAAALQETVAAGLTARRTVFVVARALSTAPGADQVLMVDGGRIVERGRHDALLTRDARYARYWREHTGHWARSR